MTTSRITGMTRRRSRFQEEHLAMVNEPIDLCRLPLNEGKRGDSRWHLNTKIPAPLLSFLAPTRNPEERATHWIPAFAGMTLGTDPLPWQD